MSKPKKKLFQQAFSVAAATSAPTKTVTAPDGKSSTTLVALPVLPASPFRPNDSRSSIEFSYDAAALIAINRAKGRRLPLDVDHNTEAYSGDKRARGWSQDLTTDEFEPGLGLEPGVLYGWFELNSLGQQELSDKLYGYTSGVAMGVWVDETHMQFVRIKSLALTNNPATDMPMAFTADGGIDEADLDAELSAAASYTSHPSEKEAQMLAALLKQLNLPEDADEAAVTAAITALTAQANAASAQSSALSAAGFADTNAVVAFAATAKTNADALTAAQAELAKFRADSAEAAAVAAVDAAVLARKITPAQRDAMLTFARADVAAFSAAMAAGKEVLSATPVTPPASATQAVTLTQEVQDYVTKVLGASAAAYEAGSK